MRKYLLLLSAIALFPTAVQAAKIKVGSVSLEPMTNAHLCRALGGQGKNPKLMIRHEKTGGENIKIKMYDNVSNGRTVNHYTTTVKSSASGVTTVDFNFLPPCNTTGNSVSSYKFSVKIGSSRKVIKWGRYDSIRKKIIK